MFDDYVKIYHDIRVMLIVSYNLQVTWSCSVERREIVRSIFLVTKVIFDDVIDIEIIITFRGSNFYLKYCLCVDIFADVFVSSLIIRVLTLKIFMRK